MSMSYADYVIAIVGHKSVVKSLQNIQTPTISNVLIVSLKLAMRFNYNTQKRLAFYFDRHRRNNQ